MASIELDIYYGDNGEHRQIARQLAKKFNLKCELVQEVGPAGGNPLYRFEGRYEDLVEMLWDYDGDNGEVEFLSSLIKP